MEEEPRPTENTPTDSEPKLRIYLSSVSNAHSCLPWSSEKVNETFLQCYQDSFSL